MVTFDEDIISTDIDRIIKIVSKKKRITLNELERETQINKKTLETWVKVLEDEKVISVDYGLTSKIISWMGGDAKEIEKQVEEKEIEHAHWKSHVSEQKPINTKIDSYSSESEYEKTNRFVNSRGTQDIKQRIMENVLEKETEKENQEEFEAPKIEVQIEAKPVIEPVPVQQQEKDPIKSVSLVVEEPIHIEEKTILQKEKTLENTQEIVQSKEKPVPKINVSLQEPRVNMKDAVSIYLKEISKQKGILNQLKKEKETFQNQMSRSLETRTDTQIETIAEKILEKEGRIIELKEQMLDLPDKVSELDKLQKLMTKIEVESKGAIQKAHHKIDQFAESIESSKSLIKSKMEQGNSLISKEMQKISELEKIESLVLETIEKANQGVSQTKNEIEKLSANVDQMSDEISQLAEMKTDISEICHSIRISVESKEQEIGSLTSELDEIGRIEKWISEYVNDYEQKIAEVTDYINRSEDEIDELRQASEAEYIKRYLAELDGIARNYEKESEEIEAHEEELDYAIGQAKQKLDALINESKLLLKKYRGQSGSVINRASFEETLSRVRQGADLVNKKLQEKSNEREKLKDEARVVRDKRTRKEEEIKMSAKNKRRKGRDRKK